MSIQQGYGYQNSDGDLTSIQQGHDYKKVINILYTYKYRKGFIK